MDDHSLKVLDYFHLLNILKELSVSSLGRNRCETLRPLSDLLAIQQKLSEVLEFKKILEALGEPPFYGIKYIRGILTRLEVEGASLTVKELIDILEHIELCRRLKRFFRKAETLQIPHLQEKVSKLSSLKILEKEILQSIDKRGDILDRASPVLLEIRDRLRGLREKAKKMLEHLLHREDLQPIFQEPLITLRNGRYVLPIKADAEHRLEGIIHDHSQSRMTYFLEPFPLIGLNNEINILVAEEKEEEYRILADLSERVREERSSLRMDVELLGELDLLLAMARLSILIKGVRPFLNEVGKVDMKEARNPILVLQDQKPVVPIHLRMGDGKKVLILSGANAGGKTVALKTLGLLTLMAQSGLPIPVAEGSQVSIFKDVFAVIGDEQNMRENLSTFSSHLLHVDQILKKSNSCSLVLLDELGVGTHASEGCALAMGFLDQFRQKGASVVVTTHFDPLKAYGYLHPDVENVAVEFDEVTLEPKYTLSYGTSGWSNAFLIAEKLGISERVIQTARRHQDGGDQEMKRALENLERLRFELDKERQQFSKMKEEATLERKRLKEVLEGIKRRREEIYSRAEARVNQVIQGIEQELKEWLQRIKEEKSPSRFQSYRKEIQKIKERFSPLPQSKERPAEPIGLKVGEHVKIKSLRCDGIISKIDEALKQVEVLTEKAKVRASFSDLIQLPQREQGEARGKGGPEDLTNREVSSVIKVIGLRVEEALPKVDQFIDQALLHGLEKVHIIHGVGSGRLRNAISQFLQNHHGVKNFSPGDGMRGGQGITVVELR